MDEIKIKVGAGCWYGVGRGWKVGGRNGDDDVHEIFLLLMLASIGFGFGGATAARTCSLPPRVSVLAIDTSFFQLETPQTDRPSC